MATYWVPNLYNIKRFSTFGIPFAKGASSA